MPADREHLTRLSALMEAARLTDPALADLAGTSKQQVFKLRKGDRKMSKVWADRLAPHLGVEWTALMEAAEQGRPAARIRASIRPSRVVEIPELDLQAMWDDEADANDLIGYARKAVWSVPSDALPPFDGDVVIITVRGDAMEPDYPSGSRVLVDCGIQRPSAPGAYVVWNGLGFSIKQVEHLAGSTQTVRISSINPRYAPYERPVEDVQVSGRVVGVWVWK